MRLRLWDVFRVSVQIFVYVTEQQCKFYNVCNTHRIHKHNGGGMMVCGVCVCVCLTALWAHCVCEWVFVSDKNIHSKGVKALSPVSSRKRAKTHMHSFKLTRTHTHTNTDVYACCGMCHGKQMCEEQHCINYPTNFTQWN